jgi:EAL domain-containing protein (putative c-di-GMP-specific phosphodiesterase class I)
MGRNQARCFDDGMLIQVEARFLLENQLRQAIPQGLRLLYQKQVSLQGDLLGAEVLVRWQHPTQGMISPAIFIPLAEETGLILPIGQWVLETACRQIKQWETHPSANRLTLAVNVSAAEIRQPDYVDKVLTVLRITGANPTRLKLELTETALATDIECVVDKMSRLRAHGVAFALDDFGTGFSSLTYLRKMPLDQLKIDRSFVREVTTNPHDASIVRTVIGLGQSLAACRTFRRAAGLPGGRRAGRRGRIAATPLSDAADEQFPIDRP